MGLGGDTVDSVADFSDEDSKTMRAVRNVIFQVETYVSLILPRLLCTDNCKSVLYQ